VPETRLQGHMLGIKIFVEAQTFEMSGGLSEAAFWVGLRQEIYSAMMNHQSIALPLGNCLVDRSVGPADDFGWANRAVVHCADVLNCCFGSAGVALSHWKELKDYSDQWKQSAPSSFAPIFQRRPDREQGEVFPEIWYSMACHSKFSVASRATYLKF